MRRTVQLEKKKKITITNDKGRLSKEDIEKMVSDAEKYKEEDEKNQKRIESKNALESYIYSVKGALNGDGVKDKLGEEELEEVSLKVSNAEEWLDTHQTEDFETYDQKKKRIGRCM